MVQPAAVFFAHLVFPKDDVAHNQMQDLLMLKLFPDITNYFGANSCFHSKSCSRTGWLVPLEGNKGRLEGPEIWAGVPAYGFHFHLQHLFNTLPLNKVIMISFNLQQVCLIFHDLPGFLVNSVLFSIPP